VTREPVRRSARAFQFRSSAGYALHVHSECHITTINGLFPPSAWLESFAILSYRRPWVRLGLQYVWTTRAFLMKRRRWLDLVPTLIGRRKLSCNASSGASSFPTARACRTRRRSSQGRKPRCNANCKEGTILERTRTRRMREAMSRFRAKSVRSPLHFAGCSSAKNAFIPL